jgi:hypothetical protein
MAGYGKRNRSRKGEGYPIEVYIEGDTGITQQWERQQDRKAVATFNHRVRVWGTKVNDALQYSIADHIAEDNTLSASLKTNYRHWGRTPQAGQEITSIGFSFEEAGLYVYLSVGRGYNREDGTVVVTKQHNWDMIRKPKPWFDPVIENHIEALQQIVIDYCGDLFINTSHILINR